MPCPPDILELGRATWTLLHSMAAYYPDSPSTEQQDAMRAWVDGLGRFYPCEVSCGRPRLVAALVCTCVAAQASCQGLAQRPRPLLLLLLVLLPLQECRRHLRKELAQHPPDVSSAAALSGWACRLHNLVNVRLGKPAFDCARALERWRDGPADDPDACGMGGH